MMQMQMAITLWKELDVALQEHGAWKKRLRDVAVRRETDLPVADIRSPACCRFGEWLNALPPILRISRDARKVERLHAAFHACAGDIAEQISKGEFNKAFAALSGEEYNALSADLSRAISRWQLAAA
ncbi:CZB domain-containing protein [Thalassovita aquimarina]|uniref:CZB domain-containing protein n=1 Tax=Thalassovita aquimarina TaxID=2785917 RepID=A0ABS5HUQ3_9RHOB|nr:CZB domain-containing protein [Thalassovita aquimarina]MBR9652522.1 CZB domain-containing protein [Thalassovita aquimarina]